MPPSRLPLLAVLLTIACGDDTGTGDSSPDTPEGDPATVPLTGECSMEVDLGGFVVEALESYSTVSGTVSDGVIPMTVLEEVAAEGDCRALRRNNPYCDPPCASDETCDFDGSCLPYPETQDMGTVRIAGLSASVAMEPVTPGFTYFDTTLSHPAFEPDVLVQLNTEDATWGAVTLHGVGVQALEPTADEWLLVEGQDLLVGWNPPEGLGRAAVTLRLTIDQHGATPVSLYCAFEDDGEGVVPAAMVDLLVTAGVTGYPNGRIARQTADSVELGDDGCMDFVVSSARTPDLRVDGYTPCHDDDDCPEGQECNELLEICE